MRNWKKPVVLVVIGIAIAGIATGSIYEYYTPYWNTRAFFSLAGSRSDFHVTDCGGEPHGPEYLRDCFVDHIFYYEYARVVNCDWGEKT